jgi:hypothetical protein
MGSQVQTDNSCLEEKILLRLNSLDTIDKEEINVLECFGGDGVIWGEVKKRSSKKINVLRINVKPDKVGFYLHGNNLKFLATIDLSQFEIIDLDAYGSPFQQLEIVFRRAYRGLIHCTFIQTGMGMINHDLLAHVGYTKAMIRKCPTLFTRKGFEVVCQYLIKNGIKSIQTINIDRKHYFWFKKA